ncbi:MAG: CinA family protein [archaeon]|nr:CinA family protein [archaeon]
MDAVGEARELLRVLSSKGLTMCAAESCTGGLIGATVTSVPGASSVFLGSAVTYANEAKERLLKVPRGILFAHGAVSPETARSMSRGAVALYGADVAVAVTGIAGPGGATDTKPVGLVYISVSDGVDTRVERFVFPGDRDEVRSQTVINALRLLREFAEGS